MSVLDSDTFARTVGAGGWGTASDGAAWALILGTASTLSVNGTSGVCGYNSGLRNMLILGSATTADGEFLARFTPSSTTDYLGFVCRYTDSSNYTRIVYDQQKYVQVTSTVAGTATTYTITSSLPWTNGQAYWIRARVVGQSYSVKVWADGGSEPSAWTGSIIDTAGPTTAGKYGAYLLAGASGQSVLINSLTITSVVELAGTAEALATVSAPALATTIHLAGVALAGSTQPGPFRTRPLAHYYVNPATGSDSNAGTALAPWATLAHAASVMNGLGAGAAGAWVHAAPGTYNESQILLRVGGTATAHLIFVSDTPGAAKIVTSDTSAAIYLYTTASVTPNAAAPGGVGHVEIVGFDVTDAAPHVCVDGIKIGFANTLVYGCRVHDMGSGLSAGSGSGAIDTDNYGDGLATMGVEVACNTVLRCGPSAGGNQAHGIYLSNVGAIARSNLCAAMPAGNGINARHNASHLRIVGNTCVHNYVYGIGCGSDTAANTHNVIANNVCAENGGYLSAGYGIRTDATGGGSTDYNALINNCCYGNVTAATSLAGAHDTNTGLVSANPQFVNDLANGSGDYSLASGSPCIAAGAQTLGAPALDVRGAHIPTAPATPGATPAYDIGAFGYQPTALVAVLVVVASSGGQSGGGGAPGGSGGSSGGGGGGSGSSGSGGSGSSSSGAIIVVGPLLAPSFTAALQAAGVVWNAGVDLLASDESTALEPGGQYDLTAADRMLPGSASISLDTTMATMRTLTLSLRSSDGRYLPGAAGYPSGGKGSALATGLTWLNVRYRAWLDLLMGDDATGAPQWQRTYLGVFVLTQPQITRIPQQSVAQLTLGDKSVLLQKPYTLVASNVPTYTASGGHSAGGYPAGMSFDAAMRDMATRAGVPSNRLHFEPSSLTLPSDYAVVEGDEPWTHLQTLAAAMPHICYFDALGNLVRRSNPLAVNAPSQWTFAEGPLSTISQVQRTTDFTATVNHIVVLGGSSSTQLVRGEAQLNDASSPYHRALIGDRVAFWGQNGLGNLTPDPTIGSVGAAQAKAQLLLARYLGQQETIQIQGRTIPQLSPYDRVSALVAGAGLATDAQVTQQTISLDTTGQMTITAGKWLAVGS